MNSEERSLLRTLLTRQRVLSLGVLAGDRPYVGLLPYVMRPDLSAALVHASRLARHSRGLAEGAPFAALVQAPHRPGMDPLQIPRVTLEGRVRGLERDQPDWTAGRELYLAAFPTSARTFQLGDFRLWELAVERGRFVAGFGSAHTVTPAALAELA